MKRSPMPPRTTPLKQQAFKRADRIESSEVTKLQLKVKEPKRRQRKCAVAACRQPFEPRSMTHKCCGPVCALVYAEQLRAKADRIAKRAGLEKLKTRRDYLKTAQTAFNAFIRERDKDKPCICCGRTSERQYLTGTNWDCGHYRSTGSAPHMRFVENNAHRQLVYCNRNRAGNAVDYRVGLIARIGLAAVEELEADQTPRKWNVDELKDITATYRGKLKQLKQEKTQ